MAMALCQGRRGCLMLTTSSTWIKPIVASLNRYQSSSSLYRRSTELNRWGTSLWTRCVAGFSVKLPALSPTMTEGSVVRWHKNEGDDVAVGDVLFELETDKATMEVESTEDGILAKILVSAGSKPMSIGTTVALMVEEGQDQSTVTMPAETETDNNNNNNINNNNISTTSNGNASVSAAPASFASSIIAPSVTGSPTAMSLSPAARYLLTLHSLDHSKIPATGPRGHLLKGDILSWISTSTSARNQISTSTPLPSKASATQVERPAVSLTETSTRSFVDVEATQIRQVIARRLTESKQLTPHAYASIDCRMDAVLALREYYKEKMNAKMSANDFVIKAAAHALRRVPRVNGPLIGGLDSGSVDISIAVATETGLVTPIVFDADKLGIGAIADKVRELASRARLGKLQPQEFMGGTFSISNLGMFGISSFTAIINPPQIAILAVGAAETRVDAEEFAKGTNALSNIATVQLSYDERVINGADAAQWLAVFRDGIENPKTLL